MHWMPESFRVAFCDVRECTSDCHAGEKPESVKHVAVDGDVRFCGRYLYIPPLLPFTTRRSAIDALGAAIFYLRFLLAHVSASAQTRWPAQPRHPTLDAPA